MTSWDRLPASDEEAVRATVLGLYHASSTADPTFFDSHFRHREGSPRRPGPDESVFIGTDPTELAVGNTEIRDFWSGIFAYLADRNPERYPEGRLLITAGPAMIISGMKIPESDGPYSAALPYPVAVAWVADRPTLTLGSEYECRFTAALVKMVNLDQWLFAQAHLSMGVLNDTLNI